MKKTPDNLVRPYLSDFALFEKSLDGPSSARMHGIRTSALASFAALGFPTTHNEEWRFTNVEPIAKTGFRRPPAGTTEEINEPDVASFALGSVECTRLVFLNGFYSPRLSNIRKMPAGAKVGSLASALRSDGEFVGEYLTRTATFKDNAFTALNTAFMTDGAFLYVPEGVTIPDPIHLLFISTGGDESFISYPRNVIIVENGSRLSVVESYVSMRRQVYFTNAVTDMSIGARAVVEHDKLQKESPRAFHIGTMYARQHAGSTLTSNSVSLGGALVRNNVNVILDGQGSECTLNGLSLATGTQHVDNHTAIDHASPMCVSHELYKCILDGKAKGVFNGKIFVRKDAQKTDAKQTNKTLLLSDDATINTKPQLEIFADDVKCTHGATVGQLDEEQIFYLRARGVAVDEARDMLTFAFASDVTGRIHVEPLREQLEQVLRGYLQQGRLAQEQ